MPTLLASKVVTTNSNSNTINKMQTNTTAKCMAFYMKKIKSGAIDIAKEFTNTGRKKDVIDLNELKF